MGWETILAVLAFVAGALFMGRRKKSAEADAAVDVADAQAAEAASNAKAKYDARIKNAKLAVAVAAARRARTNDPIADMRKRLDR